MVGAIAAIYFLWSSQRPSEKRRDPAPVHTSNAGNVSGRPRDVSECRRSPETAVFFLARESLVIIRAEGAAGLTG
jgi:hypothetical protein